MQNQTTAQDQALVQEQATGPVEIDASLLHLVGGGTPKGTWGVVPAADATVTATGDGNSTPKGTW